MDHSSQVRMVDGAKTAVLFIHGILGTPRHFSHILPLVEQVPEHMSFYNLCLPGHGGSVEDFTKSSMQQWKAEVWKVFRQLAENHEKIVIVGHSMGTLFALQLAVEFPDQVAFLFLIASPIRPWVSLRGIGCCLRASFGCAREDHPAEMAILRAGGTKLTKKLWRYIPWAPHMICLLLDAHATEKLLQRLQTKTLVFQSKRDEMVSLRSGKILEQLSCVSLTTLPGSTHFYYPPIESEIVCSAFTDALTQLPM
jgi:carboxylesterase